MYSPVFSWLLLVTMMFLGVFTKSPLMSSLLLVVFSFETGLVFLSKNMGWVFYSLVILFVGGMMVLFLYVCCLVSTLKFKVSYLYLLLPFVLVGVSMMNEKMEWQMKESFFSMIILSYSTFFILILGVYLLSGLFISTKISSKFDGPLKSYE